MMNLYEIEEETKMEIGNAIWLIVVDREHDNQQIAATDCLNQLNLH